MEIMKKYYLASMKWAGLNEPICISTNKKTARTNALKLLKEEHGTGPVDRGSAMCSIKITSDDVEVEEVPFFS